MAATLEDREDKLDAIVADYLRSVREGSAPSRTELLARYPEFAEELDSFLADREELERLARPIRQTIAPPVGFTLPHEFGPYRLEAELGRGGMGIVYRAQERRVQREVAVKVLQQGPLASEEDRLRLRLEAEAIARMGYHPHIVPLLDVGSEQGYSYLAMQFIHGPNLAQIKQRYLGRHRAIAELVATLADTIQHAHRHGIAHRDLKPSNVLLSVPVGEHTDLPLEDYRPVVSDFGLARLLANSTSDRLTLSGAVLGTPAYMAPEQARGEEATLSVDVYGLGAILYDLLAGRPPYLGAPLEVLRKVSDEEPVPPRELNPGVPRDLETICLKCLRKDPAQRYASARELAEDLRRYLAGEPVLARPVGLFGRAWRWMGRQPLAAGLLVALFVVFCCGLSGATVLWLRAEANFQRAEREAREADTQFALARTVVRDFCLRYAEEAEQAGGLQPATRELLERALSYYALFLQRHADDPALREELASIHELIGKVHLALGDRAKAAAAFQAARELFAQFHSNHPDDPRWMRRVVAMTTNLGTLQLNTQETLVYFEESLSLSEHFLSKQPGDQDLLEGKAHALANLGALWEKRGDRAQARACYEAGRDLLRELKVAQPNRESVLRDLAFALTNLAALRSHERDGQSDSLKALEEALQIRERLYKARPGDPRRQADLAGVLHMQAVVLRDAKEPKKSREGFDRALKLREALVERNPGVVRYQADLAATLKQIGFTISASGNKTEALEYYRKAVDRYERVVKAAPEEPGYQRDLGLALSSLGSTYGALDRRPEERAILERARVPLEWLIRQDQSNVDAHHHLGHVLHNLAFNLSRTGNPEGALQLLGEAVEHSRRALDRSPELPSYRKTLDVHFLLLSEIYWKKPDITASLEAIRSRQALWPGNSGQLYHSGREIARLLAVANLTPTEELSLWGELEEALRAASRAGFRDWERVQRESEWEAIRGSNRLRDLLASMP
jgi:serine/threonine-protein kinase